MNRRLARTCSTMKEKESESEPGGLPSRDALQEFSRTADSTRRLLGLAFLAAIVAGGIWFTTRPWSRTLAGDLTPPLGNLDRGQVVKAEYGLDPHLESARGAYEEIQRFLDSSYFRAVEAQGGPLYEDWIAHAETVKGRMQSVEARRLTRWRLAGAVLSLAAILFGYAGLVESRRLRRFSRHRAGAVTFLRDLVSKSREKAFSGRNIDRRFRAELAGHPVDPASDESWQRAWHLIWRGAFKQVFEPGSWALFESDSDVEVVRLDSLSPEERADYERWRAARVELGLLGVRPGPDSPADAFVRSKDG